MFLEQRINLLMARYEELRLEGEELLKATNRLLEQAKKFA